MYFFEKKEDNLEKKRSRNLTAGSLEKFHRLQFSRSVTLLISPKSKICPLCLLMLLMSIIVIIFIISSMPTPKKRPIENQLRDMKKSFWTKFLMIENWLSKNSVFGSLWANVIVILGISIVHSRKNFGTGHQKSLFNKSLFTVEPPY